MGKQQWLLLLLVISFYDERYLLSPQLEQASLSDLLSSTTLIAIVALMFFMLISCFGLWVAWKLSQISENLNKIMKEKMPEVLNKVITVKDEVVVVKKDITQLVSSSKNKYEQNAIDNLKLKNKIDNIIDIINDRNYSTVNNGFSGIDEKSEDKKIIIDINVKLKKIENLISMLRTANEEVENNRQLSVQSPPTKILQRDADWLHKLALEAWGSCRPLMVSSMLKFVHSKGVPQLRVCAADPDTVSGGWQGRKDEIEYASNTTPLHDDAPKAFLLYTVTGEAALLPVGTRYTHFQDDYDFDGMSTANFKHLNQIALGRIDNLNYYKTTTKGQMTL